MNLVPIAGPIAGGPAPKARDPQALQGRRAARVPAREPDGQPQRVPGAAEVALPRKARTSCRRLGAIAVANTIAYLSELLDPSSIFLGLTRKNLIAGLALPAGEGETGLMVYTILLRYWEWTAGEDVRPRIHLLSD